MPKTKLARCKAYGQLLIDFKLPINALYGQDAEGLFAYTHPHSDYITFQIERQAGRGHNIPLKVWRRLPYITKNRDHNGNYHEFPNILEWREVDLDPASPVYTAILQYFGSIPSASDPRLWLGNHCAPRDPHSKNRANKAAHQCAPGMRKVAASTDNIYNRRHIAELMKKQAGVRSTSFARDREVSYEKWNGNI